MPRRPPSCSPRCWPRPGKCWPTRPTIRTPCALKSPKPNRLQPPHLDPLTYRDRNQVERLINRLKQFRRVATRYDKLAHSYAAFVQLRAITLWLN